jgi:hypothetical protein
MGRPKGSTNKVVETQGVEATKEDTIETTTKVDEVEAVETQVVSAKVEPTPSKGKELQKGGAFLVIVEGAEEWWSKSMLDIAFKRNSHSIEIPKGSNYIAPANSKCENCG